MQLLRSARWMVLAFLLSLVIPATSHAGVFISVAIAPPPLLVYDQPPCPEPGWIWTPGYWAYDYDSGGYYWVPGTWIPAPYVGALWTPGFWGWQEGVYIWHPGYWGRHVGYYGGVNYGFGYFGIGFVGGEWRGSRFAYNTAVWRVDRDRVRDVYEDRRGWDRYTIRNDRHVAYAGGPGGIRHDPSPDERNYMREDHMQPTNFQQQHIEAAAHDRSAFFNNNHGRPGTVAAERPLTPRGGDMRPNGMNNGGRQSGQPDNRNGGMNPQNNNRNDNRGYDNRNMDRPNNDRPNNQGPQYAPGTSGTRPNYGNPGAQGQPQNQPNPGMRQDNRGPQNQPQYDRGPQYDNRGPQNQPGGRPQYDNRGPQNNNPGPQNNNRGPDSNMRNRAPERQAPQQIRPQPAPQQPQPQPQVRQEPQPQPRQAPPQQMRPQPEIQRPMPQARPQPEARPAPEARPQESRPAPQQRNDRGNGHGNEHERDK